MTALMNSNPLMSCHFADMVPYRHDNVLIFLMRRYFRGVLLSAQMHILPHNVQV